MVRVKLVEGGWSKQRIHSAKLPDNKIANNNFFCALKVCGTFIQYVVHVVSLQPVLEETTCDVTTVILCGHTHSQTSILEHSLHNCLSRLRCVLSDGCAVRGGGWVEGEMAGIIRNTKTRKSVRDIFTRKLQLFTIFLLTLLGKVILNTVCEIVVVCVNFPNYCTPTHFAHMPEPWIYSVLHADWLAGVRAGILRQLQQR